MKKILVMIITFLSVVVLQLFYINYHLEQRIEKINEEQVLTGMELQKLETQVFKSTVKLSNLKTKIMKQKPAGPSFLIAAND